jgi:hypothetical protein
VPRKGIIDPTKVVRAALQDAASVAGPACDHRGDQLDVPFSAVIARFRRATQYSPLMRMIRSLAAASRFHRIDGDYQVPRIKRGMMWENMIALKFTRKCSVY